MPSLGIAVGHRSPRLKLICSKGGSETGASPASVSTRTQWPPLSSKTFQRARVGVDKPQVNDLLARVDCPLRSLIECPGRWRKDFAHPVRRKRDVRHVGVLRHAFAPPTRQIGHHDIVAQVQFRLVDDPPAAGAVAVVVEGASNLGAEPPNWPWRAGRPAAAGCGACRRRLPRPCRAARPARPGRWPGGGLWPALALSLFAFLQSPVKVLALSR